LTAAQLSTTAKGKTQVHQSPQMMIISGIPGQFVAFIQRDDRKH
jgi:hypothetical protein